MYSSRIRARKTKTTSPKLSHLEGTYNRTKPKHKNQKTVSTFYRPSAIHIILVTRLMACEVQLCTENDNGIEQIYFHSKVHLTTYNV